VNEDRVIRILKLIDRVIQKHANEIAFLQTEGRLTNIEYHDFITGAINIHNNLHAVLREFGITGETHLFKEHDQK
jgi:hypothetical protein